MGAFSFKVCGSVKIRPMESMSLYSSLTDNLERGASYGGSGVLSSRFFKKEGQSAEHGE